MQRFRCHAQTQQSLDFFSPGANMDPCRFSGGMRWRRDSSRGCGPVQEYVKLDSLKGGVHIEIFNWWRTTPKTTPTLVVGSSARLRARKNAEFFGSPHPTASGREEFEASVFFHSCNGRKQHINNSNRIYGAGIPKWQPKGLHQGRARMTS